MSAQCQQRSSNTWMLLVPFLGKKSRRTFSPSRRSPHLRVAPALGAPTRCPRQRARSGRAHPSRSGCSALPSNKFVSAVYSAGNFWMGLPIVLTAPCKKNSITNENANEKDVSAPRLEVNLPSYSTIVPSVTGCLESFVCMLPPIDLAFCSDTDNLRFFGFGASTEPFRCSVASCTAATT